MSKKDQPMFSIITATLNNRKTIERCVSSVLLQSYPNFEYIVVDGASKDGTYEFLESKKDSFAVWISEPDTGVYNAWNKALRYVSGEWILFLGSDDILADEEVLTDVAAFINKHQIGSGLIYGDIFLVSDGQYKKLEKISVPLNKVLTHPYLRLLPVLPSHQSSFHHKSMFSRNGLFDESYRIAADNKFLVKALPNEKIYYINRLINYPTMGGISKQVNLNLFFENFRISKDLKVKNSLASVFYNFTKDFGIFSCKKILGINATRWIHDRVRRIKGKPTYWQ